MYAEAILRVEHIDTVGVAKALPSLCVKTFDAIIQQAVCGISNVSTVNTSNGSLCELFPMCEQTTPVGQCSGGVVTSLQLAKSFNFPPTATTLAAAGIHGILANLWKGNAHRPRTPILRKRRERSNCVPSLYSPLSKKPCTTGHNQICWAFPIISCNFVDT